MNTQERTYQLSVNWTAVITEDGKHIDMVKFDTTIFTAAAMTWNFARILLQSAVKTDGRSAISYDTGDCKLTLDVPNRAMNFHRKGELVLAVSLEDAEAISGLVKATLAAWRAAGRHLIAA